MDALRLILAHVAEGHGYTLDDLRSSYGTGGLPKARRNAIIAAGQAGYQPIDIARAINKSKGRIYQVLHEAGLEKASDNGPVSARPSRGHKQLGPESPRYEYGTNRLSRLRRLRDRLESSGLRNTDFYRQVCARICDVESGDPDIDSILSFYDPEKESEAF